LPDRTEPPFRADHVGSLLRPPELLRARADRAAGTLSSDALRAVEDDAIRAAVAMQEAVGLRSATDGEFRRESWLADFVFGLDGITRLPAGALGNLVPDERGRVELGNSGALLRIDSPIRLTRTIFGEDFLTLRSMTTVATPKLTIPSPSMVHYRGGRGSIDETIYPSLEEFWHDLSAAYAAEVRALSELGCTYLQLDDVSLAYVNDPLQRTRLAELGSDPDTQHLTYIASINAALANKPASMAVTVHLCRGNMRSSWMAEGSYDFVAEALFTELQVDGFFLEYDDERSGGFEPLRFVPKGKIVVLGLVTTKTGKLERKDELKRRIDEACKFVDLDQLCLSPQCGFASVVEGNAISYDQQVAKLGLVVETAAEVWA
jgi:5-methyltetrahydropteroyltriglutamate--homocysteine methyltransferase